MHVNQIHVWATFLARPDVYSEIQDSTGGGWMKDRNDPPVDSEIRSFFF